MSEQDYEYYLERRTRVIQRVHWSRERGTYMVDVENPQWSDWKDASGANKRGSVYRTLAHAKSAKRHYRTYTGAVVQEHEFRLFRRPVAPPPPWEPCDGLL